MIILKIVFLFLAVWLLFVNVARIFYKQRIPAANTVLMAVGIVGFIVLQFNLL